MQALAALGFALVRLPCVAVSHASAALRKDVCRDATQRGHLVVLAIEQCLEVYISASWDLGG